MGTKAGDTKSDVFILTLQQQVVFPGIRTSVTIQSSTFTELCEFCEKRDSTQIGVVAVKRTVNGVKEFSM
jgi:ATP-dependent Lon protease